MKLIQLSRLCAALALFSMAGCGGDGGGSGAGGTAPPTGTIVATAADNYFPLDANARWLYASDTADVSSSIQVIGTREVDGTLGVRVRRDDVASADSEEVTYIASVDGVREYAAPGSSPLAAALDGIQILRWPAQAGDRYPQIDRTVDAGEDFDGDGRSDRVTVRAELAVLGFETVTTNAGTFSRSLRQLQTIRATLLPSSGVSAIDLVTTIETWYAPNVGPVKSIVSINNAGSIVATTESLSAWKAGTLGNDNRAPSVTSATGEGVAVRGDGLVLDATFDEAIDPRSVSTGTFTVIDGAGALVPGSVAVAGAKLSFSPTSGWAPGRYTATVTAATDWVGNAMSAPRTWSFEVDDSRPGVIATSPAAFAVDVALDAPIVVTFSEVLDPASVVETNISLSDGRAMVPIQVTSEGNTVRILPVSGLVSGRYYELFLSGVTDQAGNLIGSGFRLKFQPVQGRFAYPVALLSGLTATSAAVGDVNGDGLSDVLLGQQTIGVPFGAAGLLYLRTGLVGGGLSEPVEIDVGTQLTCPVDAIVIGDVNGDGRTDVVAGSSCGAQVLHQEATGQLKPGQFLSRVTARNLAIADLNGDGRLDVAGIDYGTRDVALWHQDGSGNLVLAATPSTGTSTPTALAIGDVNGDGRPDLVLSASDFLGQDLLVMPQQSDGSYGPIQFPNRTAELSINRATVADINGDGRMDVIASSGGNSNAAIVLFVQATDGSLGPPQKLASLDSPASLLATDINLDGRTDLVVAHRGFSKVGVYLQQADGLLSPEQLFTSNGVGSGNHALAAGDLDGDGLPDIMNEVEWLRQIRGLAGPAAGRGAQALTGLTDRLLRPR